MKKSFICLFILGIMLSTNNASAFIFKFKWHNPFEHSKDKPKTQYAPRFT